MSTNSVKKALDLWQSIYEQPYRLDAEALDAFVLRDALDERELDERQRADVRNLDDQILSEATRIVQELQRSTAWKSIEQYRRAHERIHPRWWLDVVAQTVARTLEETTPQANRRAERIPMEEHKPQPDFETAIRE